MLPDLLVLAFLLAMFGAALYFYRRCRKSNKPGTGGGTIPQVPDSDDNINNKDQ